MRRPVQFPAVLLALLALAACTPAPVVSWPAGPAPATPALEPTADVAMPPGTPDPGPVLKARAAALRAALGL